MFALIMSNFGAQSFGRAWYDMSNVKLRIIIEALEGIAAIVVPLWFLRCAFVVLFLCMYDALPTGRHYTVDPLQCNGNAAATRAESGAGSLVSFIFKRSRATSADESLKYKLSAET
ncbi:unnamed protein product [Peronospora farinosa]|uniref:Uncharacterized protein n=1 Tax=Peronospora farinosa TaxID=134698 RepID=A0ABN8CHZ3_9STRA|nr:unnamed protein product [Peronospora farinosa]